MGFDNAVRVRQGGLKIAGSGIGPLLENDSGSAAESANPANWPRNVGSFVNNLDRPPMAVPRDSQVRDAEKSNFGLTFPCLANYTSWQV
jgi:hypothetical protein